MVGYIYRLTNIQTNKCYVGITEDFSRRQKKHIKELNSNVHHSAKLQADWNLYGKDAFEWTFREVNITEYDDLYRLEVEEIARFNSYNNGYNCNKGGKIQDWKQIAKNEDIVKFLCIQWKYGDGYGKTCEQIFGWAKGTASAAKRKVRYVDANIIFENLSNDEKARIAEETYNELNIQSQALQRQLTQGGCEQAYRLTQNDYNFAFAAQELNYTYTAVAAHLGIKSATVKDWFNGRSRVKERQLFDSLLTDDKNIYYDQVKAAKLEQYMYDKLTNKNEDDIIDYLCYIQFFPSRDAAIERLYNWPQSTCHHILLSNTYPHTKAKFSILSTEQRRERANKLNHQLIGHA